MIFRADPRVLTRVLPPLFFLAKWRTIRAYFLSFSHSISCAGGKSSFLLFFKLQMSSPFICYVDEESDVIIGGKQWVSSIRKIVA